MKSCDDDEEDEEDEEQHNEIVDEIIAVVVFMLALWHISRMMAEVGAMKSGGKMAKHQLLNDFSR